MKKKRVFIIIILSIIVSIIFMNTSNAALQSNNGTKVYYNFPDWLKNIRNMEASGGTFGLNAEIDENTLLDKGASNGLDVHMEKNTEYGAVAILSASSYGNPDKVSGGGATTTGNATGVVMDMRAEFIAAFRENCVYGSVITNADSRYKNLYQQDSSGNLIYFKGDAMKETAGWYNAAFNFNSNFGYLSRYYETNWSSGGIFDVCEHPNYYTYDEERYSRAVVVIGDGI